MGGILHFPKVQRNMLHILALQSAVILFGGKFNASLLGHMSYNSVVLDIKPLHRIQFKHVWLPQVDKSYLGNVLSHCCEASFIFK